MLKIRTFTENDRVNVIALWKVIFPNEPTHNEPSKVLDEKLAVDDRIYLAELEGRIVGTCMAGYDGHRGWLYSVAVDPSVRRQGAGSQLVRHALNELVQDGCRKVNLQIRPDNTQVSAFYQSLGFKIEDRLSMGVLTNPKN